MAPPNAERVGWSSVIFDIRQLLIAFQLSSLLKKLSQRPTVDDSQRQESGPCSANLPSYLSLSEPAKDPKASFLHTGKFCPDRSRNAWKSGELIRLVFDFILNLIAYKGAKDPKNDLVGVAGFEPATPASRTQ
ncbi:MAG TPA: hypothetical protein VKS24_03120 [Bradyrhizobium sp.]|nr:hypothetical protein [Bradyrhizobium sp.]